MTTQYIGARYVPIFDGEYNIDKVYEPLTIVTFNNATYTSKKEVPAGIEPTNTEYWALSGTVNGQILDLQNRMTNAESDIEDLHEDVAELKTSALNLGQSFEADFLGRLYYPGLYQSSQGACRVSDTRIVIGQYRYGTNSAVLVEYDIVNNVIIRESTVQDFGHINWLAYDRVRNKLYIDNGIIVDYNTLTIERDAHTRFILTCDDIGGLYGFAFTNDTITMSRLDDDFNVVSAFDVLVPNLHTQPSIQNLCIYKDIMYLCTGPNGKVIIIDMINETLINIMQAPVLLANYYPLGEINNFVIMNDRLDFVITGKPRAYNAILNDDSIGNGITALGFGNLVHGVCSVNPRHISESLYGNPLGTLSVAESPISNYPTGTTNAPFTPGDLCILIEHNPKYRESTIKLLTNLTTPINLRFYNSKGGIDGNGKSVPSLCLIDSNCKVSNINLTDPDSSNYVCNIYNSNVVIIGMNFTAAQNQSLNVGLNSRVIANTVSSHGHELVNTYAEYKYIE